MGNSYGVKALEVEEEAVYVTGPDGKIVANAGIARLCKTADEANAITEANALMAARIAAALNACHGIGTGAIEHITQQQEGLHGVLSELEAVKAQRDEARSELAVTDQLLTARQTLLDAIPACPAHGSCVPHAIEWVGSITAQRDDLLLALKAMRDEFRAHDLPYGSAAYAQANTLINKIEGGSV